MNSMNSVWKGTHSINLVSLIIAFLFFLSLYPYFVWSIEPYSNWWLSVPLFILLCGQVKRIRNSGLVLFFGFISIWAGILGGGNMIGVVMIAIVTVMFAVNELFLIRIYSWFRLIYVVMIAISLVVYLLVTFGISLPHYSVPPPPRNTIDFPYYIYPFYACRSVDDWRDLGINRFNALFDEPGVVGTISFILLYIEKFNLKKVGNYILLVSGFFSFSLFFYIACFFYFVYQLFFVRTKIIYKIISGGVVLLCFSLFVKTELFEGYIGDRLIWESQSKTISGDDRSSADLKKHISDIRGTTAYFFGEPEAVPRYQESASLEKQILAHGFIIVAMFFLFFVLYSHKYLKTTREWALFLLFFFSIMYNRPTMFSFSRLYLYCIMVLAWSTYYKDTFEQLDIASSSRNWLLRKF